MSRRAKERKIMLRKKGVRVKMRVAVGNISSVGSCDMMMKGRRWIEKITCMGGMDPGALKVSL